jgi:hypothetical protein
MSAREEWNEGNRNPDAAAFRAALDAAQLRHSSSWVREDELKFTAADEVKFQDLFTEQVQQQQPVPPGWLAWEQDEPEDEPAPELSRWHGILAITLLTVTAWLIILLVGRLVWQGIAAIVGAA